MISLGVCAAGVGTLRFCEKGVKIDQEPYLDILKSVYWPAMEELIGPGYALQQDGALPHTARSVTQWIKSERKFEQLPWPANSPGLSPLDYSASCLIEPAAFGEKPKTELELRLAVRKAFKTLEPKVVHKCVMEFKRRL